MSKCEFSRFIVDPDLVFLLTPAITIAYEEDISETVSIEVEECIGMRGGDGTGF